MHDRANMPSATTTSYSQRTEREAQKIKRPGTNTY